MGDIEINQESTDDILTDEENLFNSTQDIYSKGLTLKSEYLYDDIKKIVQYVQPTKRSEKTKELDVETFRYDIYTRNQSGFCTPTPIGWALALEKYISKTGTTRCRWVHKEDKSTLKIISSELSLYFNTTNLVKIIINYLQGYLMVKGAFYKKWIDEEFPKVLEEKETNVPQTTDINTSNDLKIDLPADDTFDVDNLGRVTSIEDIPTSMLNEQLCNDNPVDTLPKDITYSVVSSVIETSPDEKLPVPICQDIDITKDTNPLSTEQMVVSVDAAVNTDYRSVDETEVDFFWKKLDETDTAIKTQDIATQKIINRCQDIELKII